MKQLLFLALFLLTVSYCFAQDEIIHKKKFDSTIIAVKDSIKKNIGDSLKANNDGFLLSRNNLAEVNAALALSNLGTYSAIAINSFLNSKINWSDTTGGIGNRILTLDYFLHHSSGGGGIGDSAYFNYLYFHLVDTATSLGFYRRNYIDALNLHNVKYSDSTLIFSTPTQIKAYVTGLGYIKKIDADTTYINISKTLGKNLFDKRTVTTGYFVSSADAGTLLANGTYSASNWIPVASSTVYCQTQSVQMSFFDRNLKFISALSPTSSATTAMTFTTPSNCAFIRITVFNTNLNTEQVELGSINTSYVAYDTSVVRILSNKSLFTHIHDTSNGSITIAAPGINNDINLVPSGKGAVTISGGHGLEFIPNVGAAGPDYGVGIGGMAYRMPTEAMTTNFLLMRMGWYVFEGDSAIWRMSLSPVGLDIGNSNTTWAPHNILEICPMGSQPAIGTTLVGTAATLSSSFDNSSFNIGQDATHYGIMLWKYNATVSLANLCIGSRNGSNSLQLQQEGGRVLIGTATDDGKNLLQISGSVAVKDSILVGVTKLTVPDYVFSNSHKDLSISAMTKFIKKNKHLPTIPSANDLTSQPLNIVSFNMKLLEAIEVQAKYISELERRLRKLENKRP